MCNEHGRNQSYKTRFDFFCPEDDEEILNPVILISTDKCIFSFLVWHRGKNCESHVTTGCMLKLPEYEQTLDLSVFKKDTFYDVFSTDKSKHFQLNICGGITKSNRCDDNIHVCDISNKVESKILSGKDPIVMSYFDQDHIIKVIVYYCVCMYIRVFHHFFKQSQTEPVVLNVFQGLK